jgi:tetratricopeptide (TPR) repeat protein
VVAQEAVAIWRKLAARMPSAFQPDLALGLKNLAFRLSEVGQREAALATAHESVGLYRTLAAREPDIHGTELAWSLSFMGDCLEELDRTEEAIASDEQAIEAMAPYLAAGPEALVRMRPIAQDYLRRCKKLSRHPDTARLRPILELLAPMPDGLEGDAEL